MDSKTSASNDIFYQISQYLALTVVLLIPINYYRFTIGSIPTNPLEVLITAAIIAYAINSFQTKKQVYWPFLLPIAFILIGIISSSVLALDKRMALGIFKGWFLLPILFFWLVVNLAKANNQFVKLLNWALFINILAVSLYAIFQYFKIIPLLNHQTSDANILLYPKENRALAFFESPNFLAMYLTPSVIYLSVCYYHQKHLMKLTALAVPLIAIFLSRSNGALMAIVSSVIFYFAAQNFYLKGQKRQFWAVVAGAFLLMMVILYFNLSDDRKAIYQVSLDMIKNNWLSGIGSGQFKYYFEEYQAAIGEPLFSLVLPFALHPHNIFLNYWLSGGLMAIVGFTTLLVEVFKQRLTQALLAPFAGLIAILIHGLVDSTYFKNDLALIFYLIVAIAVASADKDGKNS